MCLHIIFATWLVILYCPVQLCVLGQNNCPGQFLRCFIVSRRWATWQPSVALLHFLSRSPPSTNANTNTNFIGNNFFLLSLPLLLIFFSTFDYVWFAKVFWYSMLSRSFMEFSWQFCLKYCCRAQNCSHIFRDKKLYKNITFRLSLGATFFWVNSWTMLNSDLSLLWKVIQKPESTFSH